VSEKRLSNIEIKKKSVASNMIGQVAIVWIALWTWGFFSGSNNNNVRRLAKNPVSNNLIRTP
jgi:hypothetical protein